jgi:hypothetical protein
MFTYEVTADRILKHMEELSVLLKKEEKRRVDNHKY